MFGIAVSFFFVPEVYGCMTYSNLEHCYVCGKCYTESILHFFSDSLFFILHLNLHLVIFDLRFSLHLMLNFSDYQSIISVCSVAYSLVFRSIAPQKKIMWISLFFACKLYVHVHLHGN